MRHQVESKLLKGLEKEYSLDVAKEYQGMRVPGVVEMMRKKYIFRSPKKKGRKGCHGILLKDTGPLGPNWSWYLAVRIR